MCDHGDGGTPESHNRIHHVRKYVQKFEVQPLVLRNMPDHINIGIRFMRQLQLKVNYDDVMDSIWAPMLGRLTQDPLANGRPVCSEVYGEESLARQLSAEPSHT